MTYEDILQSAAGGSATATPDSSSSSSATGRLAVRIDDSNPNHHLWNNRGTWWCHFTLHKPDYTAERVRVSLRTRNLEEARARRDQLLATAAV